MPRFIPERSPTIYEHCLAAKARSPRGNFTHGCPNGTQRLLVVGLQPVGQRMIGFHGVGSRLHIRGVETFNPHQHPKQAHKNIRIIQKNDCSVLRSTVNLNLRDVRAAKSAAKLPGQQSRYSSRGAVENQNGHRQWYEDGPYHPMAPLLPTTERQHLVCKHLPKLLQLFSWPDLSFNYGLSVYSSGSTAKYKGPITLALMQMLNAKTC